VEKLPVEDLLVNPLLLRCRHLPENLLYSKYQRVKHFNRDHDLLMAALAIFSTPGEKEIT